MVLNTATRKMTVVSSAEPAAESRFPGGIETRETISCFCNTMGHFLTVAITGSKGPGFGLRYSPDALVYYMIQTG